MRRALPFVPLCLSLALPLLLCAQRARADPTWTLVWNDEFNGAANAVPDSTRWTYDLGGGGWGNNELETYTNAAANCSQDGAGHLVISAIDTAGNYTSARIKTQTLFDQAYGRVEASINVPWGVGVWPAFWMLGSDINTDTWPACGEIDLMENLGQYDADNVIGGHIHGPVAPGGGDYNGGNGVGTNYTLPSGVFPGSYHVFAAQWSPTQIVFYVDGAAYQTITAASLPSGGQWVFNHPFFILLNLAVGGTAGSPSGTAFPQQMLVDYVRVYKLTDNGTSPYGGTAVSLPNTVQAENYDSYTDVSDPAEPGEGFAYNGLGAVNIPGQYRAGDAVSIEACSDTGEGYDVTDTSPGQWLQYTVNASQSGVYTLDARVASAGAGGTFHVDVDGNTVTGELNAPNTGGWQTWGDVIAGGITLSAGTHTVLLVEDSMGAGDQGVCNFNYLSFSLPGSPTSSPTASAGKSATATPSVSVTATASPTTTRTPSITPSLSPSLSPSETRTNSASVSPSPTATDSPDATASPSAETTVTPTPSLSATGSGTPTGTPSVTLSPSQSASASASPSPSETATQTWTSTAQASVTATLTVSVPSRSATPTDSPIASSESEGGVTPAFGPGSLRGYPIPDPNPRVFRFFVGSAVDSVQAYIYTAALVRVAEVSAGSTQAGWITLPLPPDFMTQASRGLYYFQATATRGGAEVLRSKPGLFFMLR